MQTGSGSFVVVLMIEAVCQEPIFKLKRLSAPNDFLPSQIFCITSVMQQILKLRGSARTVTSRGVRQGTA